MENLLRLTNNGMNLELLAVIGKDALLKRLNDNSFIVCRFLRIHNDFTCDWGYALGYFSKYDDAFNCFNEKVITPFKEYEEVSAV